MRNLTEHEVTLIQRYESYDLKDLYNEIGNTIANSPDEAVRKTYVLGTPNVQSRGAKVVQDTRTAICAQHTRIEQLLKEHKDVLEPLDWAATIGDVILSLTVTAGIPPWAVASALGKLCNRTISKLCG